MKRSTWLIPATAAVVVVLSGCAQTPRSEGAGGLTPHTQASAQSPQAASPSEGKATAVGGEGAAAPAEIISPAQERARMRACSGASAGPLGMQVFLRYDARALEDFGATYPREDAVSRAWKTDALHAAALELVEEGAAPPAVVADATVAVAVCLKRAGA